MYERNKGLTGFASRHFPDALMATSFVLAVILGSKLLSEIDHRQHIESQLDVVTRSKVDYVDSWRRGLMTSARLLSKNSVLNEAVDQWSPGQTDNTELRSLLIQELNDISNSMGLQEIVLMDLDGTPMLSTSENGLHNFKKIENVSLNVFDIISQQSPEKPGLAQSGSSWVFYIPIPLVAKHDTTSQKIVIVLVIDPTSRLFPGVKSWPVETDSAESILMMEVDGKFIATHETRFSNDSGFVPLYLEGEQLRVGNIGMTHDNGVFEAQDYREQNVIVVSKRVPNTNWRIVSKIDKSEVLGATINRTIQFGILAISVAVFLFTLIHLRRNKTIESNNKLRSRSERQLKALNKHYSYLSRYANDIILLADDKGLIIEANKKALDSYQYSTTEIKKINIIDLEYRNHNMAVNEQLFSQSNEGLSFETIHIRKDSSTFPAEVKYRSIMIGDHIYRQLIVRDVTERRNTLRDLRRVERRFQLAVQASNTGVWDWNIDHESIWLSDECYKLLGYQESGFDNNAYNLLELVHPDEKVTTREALVSHMKGQEPFDLECRLKTSSGKFRWYRLRGEARQNKDGKSVRMLGSIRDITKNKLSRQKLLALNRALKTLSAGNTALVYSQSESDLLERISNVMVQQGGYVDARIYYLHDQEIPSLELMNESSAESIDSKKLDDDTFASLLETNTDVQKAIETGAPVVCQDILNDPGFADLRAQAFIDGYLSMIILPIMRDTEAFGLLIVISSSTFAFSQDEVRLLDELSHDLAYGISMHRASQEHEITRDKLDRSEIRARIATESTKLGIWELDLDDWTITFDRTWTRIIGLDTEQKTFDLDWWNEQILPEYQDVIKNAKRNYVEGSAEFFEVEYQFRDMHGNIKWADTRGTAIERRTDGYPSKLVGTIIETTEYMHLLEKQKHHDEHIEATLIDTIKSISLTVEKRDPYTAGHQNRVSQLSTAIAHELQLEEDLIKGISLGALIHDIGKIYIPSEILNRPGKLSDAEFQLVRSHAQVGFDIIKNIDFPWPVAKMVHQHHERLDGSGYPLGLNEDEIIMEAQVIAVADVIEAISSHRPYRPALGIEKGLNVIEKGSGTHYNPQIVSTCIDLIRNQGFDFS